MPAITAYTCISVSSAPSASASRNRFCSSVQLRPDHATPCSQTGASNRPNTAIADTGTALFRLLISALTHRAPSAAGLYGSAKVHAAPAGHAQVQPHSSIVRLSAVVAANSFAQRESRPACTNFPGCVLLGDGRRQTWAKDDRRPASRPALNRRLWFILPCPLPRAGAIVSQPGTDGRTHASRSFSAHPLSARS